jgi:hypothetical protein
LDFRGVLPGPNDKSSYWTTLTRGIPGFFTPNPLAHAGDFYPLGADQAGSYSTAPLEATIAELVDFNLINDGNPRLTVGSAHVRSSQMTYFDSRRCRLGVQHIMASGALLPRHSLRCASGSERGRATRKERKGAQPGGRSHERFRGDQSRGIGSSFARRNSHSPSE